MDISFDKAGAQRYFDALSKNDFPTIEQLFDEQLGTRPGVRVKAHKGLAEILDKDGSIGQIACSKLGPHARPVRALLFDKRPDQNWALGWHQDRTIAVRQKHDTPGFSPWSEKSGIVHVEPPFELLSKMVTLRAHIDDCGEDNAPLLITPGSHKKGRIASDNVAKIAEDLGKYACTAKRGDIWLYASSIAHASEAAVNPKRRRVLHVDYSADELPGKLEWLGV